ncbi:hypothetical protein BDM02DRAFT_3114363, partial [Thelephora ganbajun]
MAGRMEHLATTNCHTTKPAHSSNSEPANILLNEILYRIKRSDTPCPHYIGARRPPQARLKLARESSPVPFLLCSRTGIPHLLLYFSSTNGLKATFEEIHPDDEKPFIHTKRSRKWINTLAGGHCQRFKLWGGGRRDGHRSSLRDFPAFNHASFDPSRHIAPLELEKEGREETGGSDLSKAFQHYCLREWDTSSNDT